LRSWRNKAAGGGAGGEQNCALVGKQASDAEETRELKIQFSLKPERNCKKEGRYGKGRRSRTGSTTPKWDSIRQKNFGQEGKGLKKGNTVVSFYQNDEVLNGFCQDKGQGSPVL